MSRKQLRRALIIFALGGVTLLIAFGAVKLVDDNTEKVATSTAEQGTFAKPGSVPIGGPFTLTDQTGNTVTDEDFRGKYLLVFFGYTHCPDVCPTTLNEIALTLKKLGDRAAAVQPLFISVDPSRDSPRELAAYVRAFDPRIVGLTGSKEQIARVVKEYRVSYEKVSQEGYYGNEPQKASDAKLGSDYLVQHTANTYLMSPKGQYLTHFDFGTKPQIMAETIRKAIEKFGSSGH